MDLRPNLYAIVVAGVRCPECGEGRHRTEAELADHLYSSHAFDAAQARFQADRVMKILEMNGIQVFHFRPVHPDPVDVSAPLKPGVLGNLGKKVPHCSRCGEKGRFDCCKTPKCVRQRAQMIRARP